MAKVVDQDKSIAKRCTCKQCGAVVEYYPIEVSKYSGRDISGGPDGRTWIECPACHKDITLSSW